MPLDTAPIQPRYSAQYSVGSRSWSNAALLSAMTPLIVALQIAMTQPPGGSDTPPVPAPAPAAAPPLAPAPATPATPTAAPPLARRGQAPTWRRPYGQPRPAPLGPGRGQALAGDAAANPLASTIDRDVTWWARFELGFGTYGFAENNTLLTEMGYAGVKMWTTLDVAWMFHRRVGAGLLLGMNRRSSQPENAPALNVASYFIAAEIPIYLAGNRVWAFYVTPRGGYAAIDLEFDNDTPTDLQHTGTFGGALSFQSFKYHMGSSIGFMHTPGASSGALGRRMDFGGLYFTLGATIDG